MGIDSLEIELEKLEEDLLKMGRLLEEQIGKSVKALVEKDRNLAREVIEKDDMIDKMEVDIETKCLKLVALKQPMAGDLRLIASVLRNVIDIERMADHAEDIAEITIDLYEQKYIKPLIDIPRMANLAQVMVGKALKAFVDKNIQYAMSIIDEEKEMDGLYAQVFRELLSYMMQDPKTIAQATSLMLVAVHLERIGDHATNLAEMVVYVVEGKRMDFNEIARNV